MFAHRLTAMALIAALVAPAGAALAQGPGGAQVASLPQADAVAESLRGIIASLPADTSADILEAQLAAAIEQSGASGPVSASAVAQVLATPGLSANAQTALRAISRIAIAQYRKKPFAVGGVGGGLGGMPLSSSPSALAGGSSDYSF